MFGPPRRAPIWEAFLSLGTSFFGIALIGLIHQYGLNENGFPSIYGSMGATVVLLHATPNSPLVQPRNVVLGHFFSSIIGVSIYKISTLVAEDPQNLLW